ncbi:MAG: MarR family winged helix-turn-helix transcriptional regulator [Sarcina sp.]
MNNKDLKINASSLSTLISFRRSEKRLLKNEMIAIKEAGLTIGQFAVLEILYSKGNLTINQIIEGVLTTSGNITVVIKNLKRDSFVQQLPNPEDKRSSLISLTDEGTKLIESILPSHFANIEESFSQLSKVERKELIKLLNKIK